MISVIHGMEGCTDARWLDLSDNKITRLGKLTINNNQLNVLVPFVALLASVGSIILTINSNQLNVLVPFVALLASVGRIILTK
jgi:hypothetical protein